MKTGSQLALALPVLALPLAALAAGMEPDNLTRIYGGYAPLMRSVSESLLQLSIVMLVALPFQFFVPAMRRRAKFRSYEFWLDLIYWFQGAWLILLSFYAAIEWLAIALYGDSAPWFPALRALPYWAQVLIAVWGYDFAVYWRHRWEHRFSALWSFHAVHHTAEQVDVLTTTRLHPLEIALASLVNALVVVAGIDPVAAALGFSIYFYYNFFIHSNVRIRFAGPLKYVLVSPFMHHWHHAKDEVAMGRNLGVIFAWNDWLFGTAYHPQHWPASCGLEAPPAERTGQSYLRHLAYPLQFFLARIQARRAARAG